MPLAKSPDDFCRLCRGKGYLVDRLFGGYTSTMTCWQCLGSGTGH